jgi:hypothetical protein
MHFAREHLVLTGSHSAYAHGIGNDRSEFHGRSGAPECKPVMPVIQMHAALLSLIDIHGSPTKQHSPNHANPSFLGRDPNLV